METEEIMVKEENDEVIESIDNVDEEEDNCESSYNGTAVLVGVGGFLAGVVIGNLYDKVLKPKAVEVWSRLKNRKKKKADKIVTIDERDLVTDDKG